MNIKRNDDENIFYNRWSLSEQLIKTKNKVIIIDNFCDFYSPMIKERNIKELLKNKNFKLYKGDIRDKKTIKKIFDENKIDIVIHLAAIPISLANINETLANDIEYKGCENIIRSICYYNPHCHLFYASSTSLYKLKELSNINSKISLNEDDYYLKVKLLIEKLIKDKLDNYTIYRLPIILGDLRNDKFIWNGILNQNINYITREDAAYSFVRGINYLDKINKNTYNVIDEGNILYKDLINNILNIYGYNLDYIFSKLFLEKNYYSPMVSDGDILQNIIDYQNNTLNDYYKYLKRISKKRKIPKLLVKVIRGRKK